jgi:hypothetical protein
LEEFVLELELKKKSLNQFNFLLKQKKQKQKQKTQKTHETHLEDLLENLNSIMQKELHSIACVALTEPVFQDSKHTKHKLRDLFQNPNSILFSQQLLDQFKKFKPSFYFSWSLFVASSILKKRPIHHFDSLETALLESKQIQLDVTSIIQINHIPFNTPKKQAFLKFLKKEKYLLDARDARGQFVIYDHFLRDSILQNELFIYNTDEFQQFLLFYKEKFKKSVVRTDVWIQLFLSLKILLEKQKLKLKQKQKQELSELSELSHFYQTNQNQFSLFEIQEQLFNKNPFRESYTKFKIKIIILLDLLQFFNNNSYFHFQIHFFHPQGPKNFISIDQIRNDLQFKNKDWVKLIVYQIIF